VIKASLILVGAWCSYALMRNRSAAERQFLWALALPVASLLPLLSLLVPAWQPEVVARMAAAIPGMAQSNPSGSGLSSGVTIIHAVGLQPGNSIAWLLLALWVPGFLIVLSQLLYGARTLRLLASRANTLSDPSFEAVAAALMRAYGFKRHVRLMYCPASSLPITWGVFRPRVLLPGDAGGWTDGRKFAVLAHELAHIQRRDWLFQILAEISCAVYWFHPLFWVARNRLHLESERACDDAVLSMGTERREYAKHLLDIARALNAGPPVSLAMAGQVHLEKRLVAILDSAAKRQAVTRRAALAISLPLLCLALPLAAMRSPKAETKSDQSAILTAAAIAPRVVRYTTPPLYSDEARQREIEGIVTIEAQIGTDGRATNLRVRRGLGFGLDENALLAVRDWRFAPGARDGRAVDSTTLVDVEFSLVNAELNDMIANDMATLVGPDVRPPRIIHRVEPRYPQPAPGTRHGTVLLDVVIQEDGVPRIVRVLRSLTWQLDEAAIAALEEWRFSPAAKDGIPVKVRMSVEMAFAAPPQ
jgi:TonB family protein